MQEKDESLKFQVHHRLDTESCVSNYTGSVQANLSNIWRHVFSNLMLCLNYCLILIQFVASFCNHPSLYDV